MEIKKPIENIEDIRLLVDTFYAKVREDSLLGPIFENVIHDNWDEHLAKMYSFWQTVLLKERTYRGAPFVPHAKLPIAKPHFDAWLKLFHATLAENFVGKAAEEAKWRSEQMALMFQNKLNYDRDRQSSALM